MDKETKTIVGVVTDKRMNLIFHIGAFIGFLARKGITDLKAFNKNKELQLSAIKEFVEEFLPESE